MGVRESEVAVEIGQGEVEVEDLGSSREAAEGVAGIFGLEIVLLPGQAKKESEGRCIIWQAQAFRGVDYTRDVP